MKIDIVGSVASGKTTLARELSHLYKIPFFEKDNIVWERTSFGDKKRSDEERDAIFMEILRKEDWIVEGSPRKILLESFEYCDYILLLDVNIFIRLFRVIRRWIRQRNGKERYNSKPTFSFLVDNIIWIVEYSRERKNIIAMLSKYGNKYKRFSNSEQAKKFIVETYR